uniref:MORN repeat-containing protein 3 n=1 Tax=Mola mola TaxID=94237 RepID=A0A3Q3WNM6_MOLML
MQYIKTTKQSVQLTTLLEQTSQKCGKRCTVFTPNGNNYTGDWLNNQKHGIGVQIWKDSGSMYNGEWKHGKRHGFGTLSVLLPEAKKYATKYFGEWKNGKKHGYGACYYNDAEVYQGGWVEDQRCGWGIMHYDSGDIYEGEWMDDKTHGQGSFRYANTNWYEGTWRDGKKHGNGKFFYCDKGQIYEGLWEHGEAKCGTLSDFKRDEAKAPPEYPIPQLQLVDMELVLQEAQSAYLDQC